MPKRISNLPAAGRKPARAAIRAAAGRTFALHGLAGARTEAIAAAAVNHPPLYYYFPSWP